MIAREVQCISVKVKNMRKWEEFIVELTNNIWAIDDSLILLKDGSVLAVFEVEPQVINTIEDGEKEDSKDLVFNYLSSIAEYGDFGIYTLNFDLELAKKIDEDLGRGITFINGQGYYSENNLKLIYCVVGRNEMQTMKNVIHSVDPRAFITITDAHEILGEGFTLDANKQPLQR